MGILKNAAKGAINGVLGIGASKNDVKIAKLELKKAKLEEKATRKQNKDIDLQEIENIDAYYSYTKNNFPSFKMIVDNNKRECISSKCILTESNDKNARIKAKEKLSKMLPYLYLSRDYFIILTKYSNGISLSGEQINLIKQFVHFFDGKPVLDVKLEETDKESLIESIKDFGIEFKEAFIPSKNSNMTLMEYVEKYYLNEIKNDIIPYVDDALNRFENMIKSNEPDDKNLVTVETRISDDRILCSYCHQMIGKNNSFCPQCGNKVDSEKPAFCSECGNRLNQNDKFCVYCGKKV